MKKSKIINLILLTAAFTTSAKNNAGSRAISLTIIDNPAFTNTKQEGNDKIAGFANKLSAAFSEERSVIRGGFGETNHAGAEQHHLNNDQE
jgi:hypothetical protein